MAPLALQPKEQRKQRKMNCKKYFKSLFSYNMSVDKIMGMLEMG